MRAEPSRYRRLPGHRQGVLFGASLWLADDHILSVRSWRCREEYRHFYFRDIQTISLTRGRDFSLPAWMVWLQASPPYPPFHSFS